MVARAALVLLAVLLPATLHAQECPTESATGRGSAWYLTAPNGDTISYHQTPFTVRDAGAAVAGATGDTLDIWAHRRIWCEVPDPPPADTVPLPPDTVPEPPPDTVPEPEPEPEPPGTLVFADDFSSGNHHAWRNPDPGPGGNDPPDSFNPIDFTTTERAHSAPYAYAFFGIDADDPLVGEFNLQPIDRASLKLLHWGPFDDTAVAYLYSAWYYWPSSYNLHEADNTYSNIMQWKGRGNPDFDPTWIIAVSGSSGEDRIWLQDWHGLMTGQVEHVPDPIMTVPKGRWFEIRALYVPDRADGTIKVWLDGALIFSLEGVPTLGPDYTGPGPMWGVGHYGGDPVSSDGLYVDNVRVWRISG